MAAAASTTWTIIAGTGTGTGGGGSAGNPAPPVTIDATAPDGSANPVLTPRNNKQVELQIYYTLDPSANSTNFAGVAVYLEDPDISSAPAVALDGSTKLDGKNQTSAKWLPVFANDDYSTWNGTAEDHGPADLLINYSTPYQNRGMARKVRIYLAAFGPTSNPQLVRANSTTATPTPSVVVTIPAAPAGFVRGEEYAWLVTNFQVQLEEDFDRPDPSYRLLYSYTPPDPTMSLPPGMNPFGGIEIFFAYPDAKNTDPLYAITDSGVFVPMTASNGYLSPVYDPGNGGTFRVYACSGDNSQPAHVNTLIPGVTPYVQVTINYPPTTGEPVTPDVSGLKLTNPRMAWQPDGSMLAEADLSWTNPSSASFAGENFYVTAISPPDPNYTLPMQLEGFSNNTTSMTLQVLNWPRSAEQWTITAVSVDANGIENNNPSSPRAGSPQVVWPIGPPGAGGTGQENAPLVTPLQLPTPVVSQQVSNDGVQMMRFVISGWADPQSNQFGGVKIAMVDNNGTVYWDAGKTTSFTTPWLAAVTAQRIYFYVVSYNPQNQQNSLVPQPGGQTPFAYVDFTPSPGSIKASQIPNNWWNTAEFAWPTYPAANGFQANVIVAGKIAVGSVLRVGGAPSTSPFAPSFQGQNGQIAVYSSGSDPGDSNGQPTLRAWMGQQTNQLTNGPGGPTYGTVYGGWFAALYVGGNGPPTAPLYVNNGGVVTLGGWDVQTALGTTYYPYLSVRNKYNVEQGRIGAALAANPDGSRLVPVGDIADIGGAWFTQLAFGGANLADWRVLAPGDNTVRLRNINRFEIDYKTNVAPAPPYNAPYQLLLGTDAAWTSAGTTGTKFPGITLMRVDPYSGNPTTHGITVINRGIVLTADPVKGQATRGAFFTNNGDTSGGDGDPFWTELLMYSPSTGIRNVWMASGNYYGTGTLNGAGVMQLNDDQGNLSFQVNQNRDVVIGRQLCWQGENTVLIDTTGAWVGAVRASSFSASSYAVGGTPVISSAGQFVGPAGVSTPGAISAGVITGASFSVAAYGQVVDANGYWRGQPITASQAAWTVQQEAGGQNLDNVANIISALNGSYAHGYYLYNNPSGGNPVLGINGPGIVIAPSAGGLPNLNLQNNSITMLNNVGGSVFTVDLNGLVSAAAGFEGPGARSAQFPSGLFSGNWNGSTFTNQQGIACAGVNPNLASVPGAVAAPTASIYANFQYYGQSVTVNIGGHILQFVGGVLVGYQ